MKRTQQAAVLELNHEEVRSNDCKHSVKLPNQIGLAKLDPRSTPPHTVN